MFELQNNRGKDLTNMEKLKSYFMYQMYVNSPAEDTDTNVETISNYFDLYGWISLMSQLIIINRALYVNKQQEGKICAIT